MSPTVCTRHAEIPQPPGGTGVVMTMGALHAGHGSLIARAREAMGAQGQVVVTVFVNPTQFAAGEDFDRYPRQLDADVALCAQFGADVVYAPDVLDVYGAVDRDALAAQVRIDPGPIGSILEGASRAGHFAGALTVIAKLLHLTRARVAVFGEKDYQQLVLVQRMVRDLSFDVEVVPGATVRDPDGLALSSRNRYLSADDRAAAASIPQALQAGAGAARAGAAAAEAAVRSVLHPRLEVDYIVVRAVDLGEPPAAGPARLLLAARIGGTRLIDNVACAVGADA